jgi:hypothetical protein
MPEPTYALNRAEHARIRRLIVPTPAPSDIDLEGPCWIWQGKTTPNGYAKFRAKPGAPERVVHRVLWEFYNNAPVPDGLQLDHLCRTRACVQPTHFEAVTPSENTLRQDHANRRKTHCPRGHEYTPENTRTDGVRRWCRQCHRERGSRADD